MTPMTIQSVGKTAVSMILLSALLADIQAADPVTTPPQQVSSFTLNDVRGTSHSLDDFKDKRFVVCAFLGTECPLAKLYGPRLAQLAETYRERDVAFVAV